MKDESRILSLSPFSLEDLILAAKETPVTEEYIEALRERLKQPLVRGSVVSTQGEGEETYFRLDDHISAMDIQSFREKVINPNQQ